MPNLPTRTVCVVTGASSGIGLETAKALAAGGARVVAVARTPETAARAASEVRGDVRWLHADFARLDQVRRLAAAILAAEGPIGVLVNNAGGTSREHRVTEGVERTLAVNHLGPFLLTNLLLDRLLESAPARVVNVASSTHEAGRLDLDDLPLAHGYRQFGAYARSKLANVLFTYELSRRLDTTGVTANAVHPGLARTQLGHRNGLTRRLAWQAVHLRYRSESISAAAAARPVVRLACADDVAQVNGAYFDGFTPGTSSAASRDPEAAARLWALSERLTGLVPVG